MDSRRSVRGFSLLEVLIALLIFSLGLIGLAGLMVVSIKTNHSAYLRSQAIFLADNLSERMRAKIIGVWSNGYKATYPVTVTAPACSTAAPCSPDDVVLKDQSEWGNMLTQLLPASSATVDCPPSADVVDVSKIPKELRPPFNGLCTVRITWKEQGVASGTAEADQTFSWVFQP